MRCIRNLAARQFKANLPSIRAIDLSVPIYLNQPIVYDLLAILDDGFSRLSRIETCTEETQTEGSSVSGALGANNAFALLGVSFGSGGSRARGSKKQIGVAMEKIHTPASLFARLRLTLKNMGLLHEIGTPGDFSELGTADFVEFKVVLRKNPLVDLVEGMLQMFGLQRLFSELDVGGHDGKGGKGGNRGQLQELGPLKGVLEEMLKTLTRSKTLELIGDVPCVPGLRAVLSAHGNFFGDTTPADIVDGEFRVLGKCIRIIPDASSSINLLRKTSFGRLNRVMFEELAQAVSSVQGPVRLPQLVTEIDGPVLQVVPVAIFT